MKCVYVLCLWKSMQYETYGNATWKEILKKIAKGISLSRGELVMDLFEQC